MASVPSAITSQPASESTQPSTLYVPQPGTVKNQPDGYAVTADFLAKDTTSGFLQKDTVSGFLQKGV